MGEPSLTASIHYLAKSLSKKQMDQIKMSNNQTVFCHWYHSDEDADIVMWIDEKQNIIKQQVSVFGQFVEWDLLHGIRTGVLVEEGTDEKVSQINIKYDEKKQNSALNNAMTLLEGTVAIKDNYLEQLLVNITLNPTFDNQSSKDLVTKYGQHNPKKQTEKASFFTKLLNIFK